MTIGTVSFVGAGPEAPDLITLKGWRALHAADVGCCDSLIEHRLLEDEDPHTQEEKRCDA
jgi:siroheme synthase